MSEVQTVKIPDIGGASNVNVIEVLVKEGDEITADQSLITLESEKASMEIPAPFAGQVKQLLVKVGDTVNEGDDIALVTTFAAVDAPEKPQPQTETMQAHTESKTEKVSAEVSNLTIPGSMPAVLHSGSNETILAGPATRKLARVLGIDLTQLQGSGPKGRIQSEDLHQYLRRAMQGDGKSMGGASVPAQPQVDFSKYGQTEVQALSRIKKLSGANLHRNWLLVPHITQFGEADITDMEEFRQTQKNAADKLGVKMTPLVFIMKAVVAALKRFPQFNASLDANQENLILKKYFNLGVAVDTPNGLVVPVIRNVDQKGLMALTQELAEVSQRARTKGLMPADMEGSCFTISSLGGIGGTAFTPIVNVPDVAILGVSRSKIKPLYRDNTFVPRLILPLSLSYDHRVIDGAEGARFIQYLSDVLSDIRNLLI